MSSLPWRGISHPNDFFTHFLSHREWVLIVISYPFMAMALIYANVLLSVEEYHVFSPLFNMCYQSYRLLLHMMKCFTVAQPVIYMFRWVIIWNRLDL